MQEPNSRRVSRRKNRDPDVYSGGVVEEPFPPQGEIRKEPSSKNKRKKLSTGSAGYISTFCLLILTFTIYDVFVVSHNIVDIHALAAEISSSVHNQTEAVNIILECLDKIEKDDKLVNVNFIGSTGVGKTFIANILKRHFSPSVYESSGLPEIVTQKEILSQLKRSSAKYNLVVIDDLTLADVDNVLFFIERIPQDLASFVVCIFNIQETDNKLNYRINYDNINKITDTFNKAQVPFEIAKFHEFNNEQASDWIIQQLIMKNIEVKAHSEIIESVLADQNVKYHGLKGLMSKINQQL